MLTLLHCAVSEACGGCPSLSLSFQQQKDEKRAVVERVIRDLRLSAPVRWAPDGPWSAYRNRLRLAVDHDGTVRFFNAHKSADCLVVEPELREAIAAVRTLSQQEPRYFRAFHHVEIRGRDADARHALVLYPAVGDVCDEAQLRAADEAVAWLRDALPTFLVAHKAQKPMPTQRFFIAPTTFVRVPIDSFLQVNHRVNSLLVEAVVRRALASSATHAVDLFCGSGNFSLALAAAGVAVLGIDQASNAVHAAIGAAKEQNLARCMLQVRNAYLEQMLAKAPFIVADPPRGGLRGLVDVLARSCTGLLALVSCSGLGLQRDLHSLSSRGFVIEGVELFNMFPHTAHVEALTWLRAPAMCNAVE
jgi:23S rRNA (uracil1939-C5)-methyltransferase